MKTYTVRRSVELTEEDLDNIVDSAINWCAYWCDLLEYGKEPTSKVTAMSEALSHGGTLVFHIDEPFEEGGKTKFELTTDKLLTSLEYFDQYDLEDVDGPMADSILQYALFGEVVYG